MISLATGITDQVALTKYGCFQILAGETN